METRQLQPIKYKKKRAEQPNNKPQYNYISANKYKIRGNVSNE